jgi:hypothetical protein
MKEKYLNFPLCMMKKVNNSSDLAAIINFAIVHYAKQMEYTAEAVAKHIAYLFYRKSDELDGSFIYELEQIGEETGMAFANYDYFGFDNNGNFEPDDEIIELKKLFKKDNERFIDCINIYKIRAAAKQLEIEPRKTTAMLQSYYELNNFLETQEQKYGIDAWVSIRKDFVFDAAKNKIPMDQFRLMVAVKSLLRKKNFTRTYKGAILDRMFGAKTKESAKDLSSKHINLINYYSIRYRFDKLRNDTQERGLATFLPSLDRRGFYIMFGYNPEKLTQLIMEKIPRKEVKQRNKKATEILNNFKKQLQDEKKQATSYSAS